VFYVAEDYHQDYYKKNELRYKYYRNACGRDARLKQVWDGFNWTYVNGKGSVDGAGSAPLLNSHSIFWPAASLAWITIVIVSVAAWKLSKKRFGDDGTMHTELQEEVGDNGQVELVEGNRRPAVNKHEV